MLLGGCTGFCLNFSKKLPKSYGQLPQEGAQEVSNSLMLRHCANSGGRTQFAPTVVKPTLQFNSQDAEGVVPYNVHREFALVLASLVQM